MAICRWLMALSLALALSSALTMRTAIFFVVSAIVVAGLPSSALQAQSRTFADEVKVTFAEVILNEDCTRAIESLGPTVIALAVPGQDFGVPITFETGEASGLGPECRLYNGAVLDLRLNRPARYLAFNRSGTLQVTLYRDQDFQVFSDETSGLGGRFEYDNAGGFNRVVLTETGVGQVSYTALDDLQLGFNSVAISALTTFDVMGVNTCGASIALTDGVDSSGGSLQFTDDSGVVCGLAAGELLSINAALPFTRWDATVQGSILVDTEASSVTIQRETPAFFQWREGGQFSTMTLSATTGDVLLDDLRLTWDVQPTLSLDLTVVVDGLVSCDAYINANREIVATASVQREGDPAPLMTEMGCALGSGNELRLMLPTLQHALQLQVTGQPIMVQLYRNDELMLTTAVQGEGDRRTISAVGGFDAVAIGASLVGPSTLGDVQFFAIDG